MRYLNLINLCTLVIASSFSASLRGQEVPHADVQAALQPLSELTVPGASDDFAEADERLAPVSIDWFDEASFRQSHVDKPFVPVGHAAKQKGETCSKCSSSKGACGCAASVSVHRSGFFAEALYLRPANIDVVFAVEQTDPDPLVANPTGPVGIVSFEEDLGVRGGFSLALSDCTSIVASYTWYENGTSARIDAAPGTVLHSRIVHPSTATSGAASLSATAIYDLQFQRADLDYRRLLFGDCDWALNFFGGVRYATLEEQLIAVQTIAVATGLTTVTTDVDFDGYGIGLGLDTERRSPHTGLLAYGKAEASFLQGEFKTDYRQSNQFGGGVIGNTMRDNRFISILELELGIGWQNNCGNLRMTTGYVASAWFNTVTTDAYVQGFRNGVLEDLSETLTLSGLVVRAEYRF